MQNSIKETNPNKNIFIDKPEFKGQVQHSIDTLVTILESNTKIGQVFKIFEDDVIKMQELDALNAQFSQVEDLVTSLDNLVHVNDFVDVLQDLSLVSQGLKNANFDRISLKVSSLDPGSD